VPSRKIDPEHQALVDQAVALRREWTGPGPIPPHVVAHQDPDTKLLTFHLRGLPEQLDHILAALRRAA
jgi:hypothetical protein